MVKKFAETKNSELTCGIYLFKTHSARLNHMLSYCCYLCIVIQKEMPNAYGWLGCRVVVSLA